MKRVINGTTYDTDKARLLARSALGESALFETNRGRYFLAAKVSVQRRTESSDIETKYYTYIEPLEPDAALAWLQRDGVTVRCDPFAVRVPLRCSANPAGEVIPLRIWPSLKRQVEEAARAENQSVNTWILRQLEPALGSLAIAWHDDV
jgi:hypothetical protein